MVRHLRTSFDDEVFEKLKEAKGDRTWGEAMIEEMLDEDHAEA